MSEVGGFSGFKMNKEKVFIFVSIDPIGTSTLILSKNQRAVSKLYLQ